MKLTSKDVYEALREQLDHQQGYISKYPISLNSVEVDGVVSCGSIAEFLNDLVDKHEAQAQ